MTRVVVIISIIAVGIVGWLYWEQGRTAPLIVSGFIEADEVRVGSRVGGRVAERFVDEGQVVQPGAKLYRIDPFDLAEQLAEAKATAAAQQSEYDRLKAGFRKEEIDQTAARREAAQQLVKKLEAGPRAQEIEIARAQVMVAEANMNYAQTEFTRIGKLAEASQAAPTEIEAATRALHAAQGELASARQNLSLLQEGTRKEDLAQARASRAEADAAWRLMQAGSRQEDIDQAEARLNAAQARVTTIETRMEELTVTSPCACVVETIDLRPGDIVAANAPSVSLMEAARMWVRAYVPEGRLGEVKLGSHVPIRVDSFPKERFRGRVSFIARQAEFTPRNVQTPEERSKQVLRIKVELEEGTDRLRVGMAADVLLGEATP